MPGFIGAVVAPIDDARSSLFGACFAFGEYFVTGDHVVEAARERGAEGLCVIGAGFELAPVTAIHRHATLDVALLCCEHGGPLSCFRPGRPAVCGERARLFNPAVEAALTTTVLGRIRARPVSTARSRGTSPAPADARHLEYSYPALVIRAAPGHGFSGSPVWAVDDGALLGIYCADLTNRGDENRVGVALEIAAALPWLAQTIQTIEEQEAAHVG
jgi:hypothetical protein